MKGMEEKPVSLRFQLLASTLMFFVLLYHFFMSSNVILKAVFLIGFIANLIGAVLLVMAYKKGIRE